MIKTQEETIDSALSVIPSDDRDIWVYSGMAIKNALGENGFHLWDRWSRGSSKYDEYSANSVWKSISPSGGITIGWLFYKAKEYGWDFDNEYKKPFQISKEEARKKRILLEKLEREKSIKAKEAQNKAFELLSSAELKEHQYLSKKGFPEKKALVKNINGEDLLLFPMRDIKTRELKSLQIVDNEGNKRFIKNSNLSNAVYKEDCEYKPSECWYVEGYATGLSIREALDNMQIDEAEIVVCYSANNLAKVALGDYRFNANQKYIIADHDLYSCINQNCKNKWDAKWYSIECPLCKMKNPTKPAGEKAARKTNFKWWMPEYIGDANDMHLKYGIEYLVNELKNLKYKQNVK